MKFRSLFFVALYLFINQPLIAQMPKDYTQEVSDYLGQGNFPKAIEVGEAALKKIEKQTGKDTTYAIILQKMGIAYIELNKQQKAIELWTAAATVVEQSIGKNTIFALIYRSYA